MLKYIFVGKCKNANTNHGLTLKGIENRAGSGHYAVKSGNPIQLTHRFVVRAEKVL